MMQHPLFSNDLFLNQTLPMNPKQNARSRRNHKDLLRSLLPTKSPEEITRI